MEGGRGREVKGQRPAHHNSRAGDSKLAKQEMTFPVMNLTSELVGKQVVCVCVGGVSSRCSQGFSSSCFCPVTLPIADVREDQAVTPEQGETAC